MRTNYLLSGYSEWRSTNKKLLKHFDLFYKKNLFSTQSKNLFKWLRRGSQNVHNSKFMVETTKIQLLNVSFGDKQKLYKLFTDQLKDDVSNF